MIVKYLDGDGNRGLEDSCSEHSAAIKIYLMFYITEF